MSKFYLQTYSKFLKKHLKVARPLKVVCDASNGTAGIVLKEVFKNYPKVKMTLINSRPDDRFPAHGPNPLSSGALDQASEMVKKQKADLGAVFDADGDRVFFIDEKGKPLPSFVSALVLFESANPPFVADEPVYQTLRLLKSLPKANLLPSKVGTFFVKKKMKERKASVAAEYSGHFYFKDLFYSDSGVLAFIKFCRFLSESESPISEFSNKFSGFSIVMENKSFGGYFLNFKKKLKNKLLKRGLKSEERDGLTIISPVWFLNIRPSNTEPLLRFTCGSKSKKESSKILKKVLKEI